MNPRKLMGLPPTDKVATPRMTPGEARWGAVLPGGKTVTISCFDDDPDALGIFWLSYRGRARLVDMFYEEPERIVTKLYELLSHDEAQAA